MDEEGHVKSPVASHVQVVTMSNQTVVKPFSFFFNVAVEHVARTLQMVTRLS